MLDDPLDRLAELNHPASQGRKPARLWIGSDVEIAGRVREDLERSLDEIVHAEGAFWRYEETCWRPIPDHELMIDHGEIWGDPVSAYRYLEGPPVRQHVR